VDPVAWLHGTPASPAERRREEIILGFEAYCWALCSYRAGDARPSEPARTDSGAGVFKDAVKVSGARATTRGCYSSEIAMTMEAMAADGVDALSVSETVGDAPMPRRTTRTAPMPSRAKSWSCQN